MDNIPFTTNDRGLKLITLATLKKACREAAKAVRDVDHNDTFWVMTEKPVMTAEGDDGDGEEWSQTNEPELAEWLADVWETASVQVGTSKVVFLCGTEDDEYGNFWDAEKKEWVNYCF